MGERVDRKKILKHPHYSRQEWESEKHFTAFQIYRDISVERKRSLEEVRTTLKTKFNIEISERGIQHWYKNDMWSRRALAYDRYMDAKRMRQIERRRTEMFERQSMISVAMQHLVAERLKNMNADELTARDAKEWMEVASRIELRARGEAAETIKHEHYDGREAIINQANEFFKRMTLESPGMSDKDKAQIIKEAYGVDPHELGLPPEILSVQDVGDAVN